MQAGGCSPARRSIVTEKMSCLVDTTVLAYAIDERSEQKHERVASWLRELGLREAVVVSAQSINELYAVGAAKFEISRPQLRKQIEKLSRLRTVPMDMKVTRKAWMIQDETGYPFWDCLQLASAVVGGCQCFLTEDMQHDRLVVSTRIVNPFIVEPAQLLPPI